MDVVIVDLPRAGLHQSVVNVLLKIKPERIVYLSCDPATLSIDIKLLADGEFVIEEISRLICFLGPCTSRQSF